MPLACPQIARLTAMRSPGCEQVAALERELARDVAKSRGRPAVSTTRRRGWSRA